MSTTKLPPRGKSLVEWWGGIDDGKPVTVDPYVLAAGFFRQPDSEFYNQPVKASDPPEIFSERVPIIRYPIKLLHCVDPVTRKHYEKYMIDYYSGVKE